ncbi:SDR family NAD(P)-dependent oxidoreductase [Pseudomaricurvus sp. HS19]|uniref:SDR family NAD(P)-dependent oxidoreductase n=1 Tax=Pseudomaricurvus sp. HS19 TaxID=2692626 RepID=UPI001368DD61|nr:SDR family oxidoreductase [Pseudomaricurvus sp. HS19]MYM62365.1 SDR family oxidoreductase [Pseudomaricurvus sp. HS19]
MKNKVVLITGAASGLGLATATRLAVAGADLSLVDVNEAGLAQAAEQLRSHGVRVLTRCCDLSVADNCQQSIAATLAEFGRLDGLCNVAAVMLPSRTTEMQAGAFEKTLAVNLAAPFYLIQAALPHLIESAGAIVNVASAVGITAQAYNAAYCATKAGLIQMTKSLAMEYMHDKVRINAVAPGGMMTPLARNMMNVTDPDPTLLGRASPLRGLVEMDEVADMVAFLASDQAQGYHGACIVIDKGMCAG